MDMNTMMIDAKGCPRKRLSWREVSSHDTHSLLRSGRPKVVVIQASEGYSQILRMIIETAHLEEVWRF
jgi:hypothetical protein